MFGPSGLYTSKHTATEATLQIHLLLVSAALQSPAHLRGPSSTAHETRHLAPAGVVQMMDPEVT